MGLRGPPGPGAEHGRHRRLEAVAACRSGQPCGVVADPVQGLLLRLVPAARLALKRHREPRLAGSSEVVPPLVEEEERRGCPPLHRQHPPHDSKIRSDVLRPHVREDAERRDHVEAAVAEVQVADPKPSARVVALVYEIDLPELEVTAAQVSIAPADSALLHVDSEVAAGEAMSPERVREPTVAASDVENAGITEEPGVLGELRDHLVAHDDEQVVAFAHEANPRRGERGLGLELRAAHTRAPGHRARAHPLAGYVDDRPPKAQLAVPLSVAVVTWQSGAELEALVASMNRFLDGSEELIVVDNASSDKPEGAARRWKGSGWFLQMGRNLGYGAAMNAAVERASGHAVVMLNADTELADQRLPDLAATSLRLSALVGPRVVRPDGAVEPTASGPPVGAWPWVRALLPPLPGPAWLLARTAPWRLERLTPVTWLNGCCLAGPRDALRHLGPFDPRIHLYGEDLDLGLRAAKADVPSFIAPEVCRIVHKGKASSRQRFEDFGRAEAGTNGRLILKQHFGAGAERRAWWAERANLRLRVATKQLLGRDHDWDALVLAGLRAARSLPELSPGPPGPLQPPAPERVLAL